MREAGHTPSREDYNFIIRQFAAAGYQTGAWRVFREMDDHGIEPDAYSYGHCLQAVAHRLSLPCARNLRTRMVDDAKAICDAILNDMEERGYVATSLHVDLCLRILRGTADEPTFARLLQHAYGIDLENPDRLPLAAQDATLSLTQDAVEAAPRYQPLNTHVLNTIINFYGEQGNVSRMMVAYEVLTNPLHGSRHPNSAEDDEDANSFYELSGTTSTAAPLPYTTPNTSTFYYLLTHLVREKRPTLVRHYLLEAGRLERAAHLRLVQDLRTKAAADVTIPRMHLRRSLFSSAVRLADSRKYGGLLTWLLRHVGTVVRDKRERLRYFHELQRRATLAHMMDATIGEQAAAHEDHIARDVPKASATTTDSVATHSATSAKSNIDELPTWVPPSMFSDPDTPFFSSHYPPLKLELEEPTASFPPTTLASLTSGTKTFNIFRHAGLLETDTKEVGELLQGLRDRVYRQSQRHKERLGRRVWAAKRIYLRVDGKMLNVSREWWTENVNFRQPWRKGQRSWLVKIPRPQLDKLPVAHAHEGVEKRFTGTLVVRPHVRWRGPSV